MPSLSRIDPQDAPGTERELIASAQAGESWALGELYRRLNPALVRYLHVHAAGEEHDLASEVWLDVAGGLHRFTGDVDAFRRWLFTIARRRAIDAARKRTRRRTDPASVDDFTDRPGSADVEQAALDAAEGMVAARRIVAALPPDQAEVVLLRVVGELSVSEVAEIVGRPASWVSVTQHRALRRLAQHLGS